MVRGVFAPQRATPSMARTLRHILLLHAAPILFETTASLRRSSCTATGAKYDPHQLLKGHQVAMEHCKQQIWAGGGTYHPRCTCEARPHTCPWRPTSRFTSTRTRMQHAHVPRTPQMPTNSHSCTFSLHTPSGKSARRFRCQAPIIDVFYVLMSSLISFDAPRRTRQRAESLYRKQLGIN